jgi:FkbM family methyltransferase
MTLLDLPDDWQHGDLNKALKHVDRRWLALDVGAHRGILTKVMAKIFRLVWAFEPGPEYSKIERPGNVLVSRAALGSRVCQVSMADGNHNTGQRHVTKALGGSVRMTTLDRCCFEPDFIKIDVEGMEYDVLMGGEDTIRRCRPVVMFEDNGLSERYGRARGDVRKLLESWGARPLERFGNPTGDEDWVYGWK